MDPITSVVAYICIGLVISKITYEITKRLSSIEEDETGNYVMLVMVWPLFVFACIMILICKTLGLIITGKW